jgi:hypothetical protein
MKAGCPCHRRAGAIRRFQEMDDGEKCGCDESGGERSNGAQQNAKNKTAEKCFFDNGNGDRRRRDRADAAPRNGILQGETADANKRKRGEDERQCGEKPARAKIAPGVSVAA